MPATAGALGAPVGQVRGAARSGASTEAAESSRMDLRVAGGRVVARTPVAPSADRLTGDGDELVTADGLTLLPGWIDLQVNGAFGIDLTSNPDGLWDLAERLPPTGVTAFLPTLVSPRADTVAAAIAAWHAGPPDGWTGAAPLGWHIEGPFIAAAHRGTHPRESLRPVDVDGLRTWAASGAVRMVTLAPELSGAEEAIGVLTAAGVVVAAGHTGADHDQAVAAVAAGVRAVTHVCNAMRPLHHRDPGLVSVALTDPNLSLGVIADGIHIHPAVLRLLLQAAGANRIHLVTDAMAAAGLGAGAHRLGDLQVTVADDGPRNPAGGLAGSAATYDQVVRVWQAATASGPSALARVTSGTAAALLGDPDRGHLAVGARADVTGVDAAGRVALTIIDGRVLHPRDPEGTR
ncbi:MAG TPA: amidohydrolase family protein [Euzebya sp.]|nr:amidohydrolase family protein [Euzebya sp.]